VRMLLFTTFAVSEKLSFVRTDERRSRVLFSDLIFFKVVKSQNTGSIFRAKGPLSIFPYFPVFSRIFSIFDYQISINTLTINNLKINLFAHDYANG
jgi:hypothetical protein